MQAISERDSYKRENEKLLNLMNYDPEYDEGEDEIE